MICKRPFIVIFLHIFWQFFFSYLPLQSFYFISNTILFSIFSSYLPIYLYFIYPTSTCHRLSISFYILYANYSFLSYSFFREGARCGLRFFISLHFLGVDTFFSSLFSLLNRHTSAFLYSSNGGFDIFCLTRCL